MVWRCDTVNSIQISLTLDLCFWIWQLFSFFFENKIAWNFSSAQCISSIGQIIKSVCVSVSQSVSLSHKTSWTLYRSQSSTGLHQTCHQGRVQWVVVTYCFWWKYEISLIWTWWDLYDGGLKEGQIGNHLWAFDWHHNLWSWMTLNLPSSRSLHYSQIFR